MYALCYGSIFGIFHLVNCAPKDPGKSNPFLSPNCVWLVILGPAKRHHCTPPFSTEDHKCSPSSSSPCFYWWLHVALSLWVLMCIRSSCWITPVPDSSPPWFVCMIIQLLTMHAYPSLLRASLCKMTPESALPIVIPNMAQGLDVSACSLWSTEEKKALAC